MLVYVVTFAPTVAICAKFVHVEPLHRWIRNPVSFDELSVQLRLIRDVEIAVAVNPEGAAGMVGAGGEVVALAVFEYCESPTALNALTLKKYCVEAVSDPAK